MGLLDDSYKLPRILKFEEMQKTSEMASQVPQLRGQSVVLCKSLMAMEIVYKTVLLSLRALQQHLTGLWHLEGEGMCSYSAK